MISSWLYYDIFLNIRFFFVLRLIYLFSYHFSSFVCSHQRKPIKKTPIQIYSKDIEVSLINQKQPSPKHMIKLANNNTTLNLNITSYFLNILTSPDESTWNTIGGPITKKNHLGLTKHHQMTVERR